MVIVRCDSSSQIGTGHVYRDLSLAHKLKALGLKVQFCCKSETGNIIPKVTEQGFKVHILDPATTVEQEIAYLQKLQPAWVIFDHYQIDSSYETQVKAFASVFVIDDMMNRPHDCDVLLDQNFRTDYLNAYQGLVPDSCVRWLGPQYSLLPPQLNRSQFLRRFDRSPKSVLVFFGGADPTGELVKFYEALSSQQTQCQFQLVATASHQHIDIIKNLKSVPWIKIHISPPDWHGLICNCDYYFGSAGTVTWERFYFGLPGDVVCIADNQVQIAEELAKAGYIEYYGLSENINYNLIIPDIDRKAQDVHFCKEMSVRVQKIVKSLEVDDLRKIF